MDKKYILFCTILSIVVMICCGVLYTLNDIKQSKTYVSKTMRAKYVNTDVKCRKIQGADSHSDSVLILEKCIEDLRKEKS